MQTPIPTQVHTSTTSAGSAGVRNHSPAGGGQSQRVGLRPEASECPRSFRLKPIPRTLLALLVLLLALSSVPYVIAQEQPEPPNKRQLPPDLTDGAYGIANANPQKATTQSCEYITTRSASILLAFANEIQNCGRGNTVMAKFSYLNDLRVANALCEAANRGQSVIVILGNSPGTTNLTAANYLSKNGVRVFLENLPNAEKGAENFVILSQADTLLKLDIPPDPKRETTTAGLLTIRNNRLLRTTMIDYIGNRIADEKTVTEYKAPTKTRNSADRLSDDTAPITAPPKSTTATRTRVVGADVTTNAQAGVNFTTKPHAAASQPTLDKPVRRN